MVNIDVQLNELMFKEVEIFKFFIKVYLVYCILLEKCKVLEDEKVKLNGWVMVMLKIQQEIVCLICDVEFGQQVYM